MSKTNSQHIKKRNIINLLRFALLFVSLVAGTAQAVNITVSTSRNPVALDDSFHLTYEADSNVDDDPDFSPIYKDFDLLNSSQSTNMRSINGNWSLKKSWDLTVIAKKIGKFTIPAISFGKDISPAIKITVTSSTSANSTTPGGSATVPAKIFLESTIDKKSGWVQSQFIYTLKLFRTVRITGATISNPETNDPDAIIQQLSEDTYTSNRNGIRYEVYERRFAIYPQKSGTLKIKPATFEGRINSKQPQSIFDQFRMSGQLKRLHSKQITVEVKPVPAGINLQDWLPSSGVQLQEEWSGDIKNLKAGEPITRTVSLSAEGLTAVQLPDLQFDDIDGIKQYPDKPALDDGTSNIGISGLKVFKVALIPSHAGSYTLPAIKVSWWNTQTNKQEIASLAPVELTVTGAANTNTYPAAPPAIQQQPLQGEPSPPEDSAVTTSTIIGSEPGYWKWLSLFFALAWLLTLLLYFRKPTDSGADKNPHPGKSRKSSLPIKSLAARVEKACKTDNAHEARSALIKWAQVFFDNTSITNLSQITELCSPQLGLSIKQLNQALYSQDATGWQGSELLTAFRKDAAFHNDRAQVANKSALRPLYTR